MTQRRLIRAGRFLRLGKMRADLPDWRVGYVLGIPQPTAPAWQRSETPQCLAEAKGPFLFKEEGWCYRRWPERRHGA